MDQRLIGVILINWGEMMEVGRSVESVLDQTISCGNSGSLPAIRCPDLAQNGANMSRYGTEFDEEPSGYLGVGEALTKQGEDLLLAVRQVEQRARTGVAVKVLGNLFSHRGWVWGTHCVPDFPNTLVANDGIGNRARAVHDLPHLKGSSNAPFLVQPGQVQRINNLG